MATGPQLREPEEGDEHGRGLMIGRALSAAWGVEPAHDGLGKTVWFELETGPVQARFGHEYSLLCTLLTMCPS